MIEQGFNYADSTIKEMTDFYETRVKNLERKVDKKKASSAFKKSKKSHKKRKKEDSDYSVVESSKESIEIRRPSKKCYILHGKSSHSSISRRKRKKFRNFKRSNKELNAIVEKKLSEVCLKQEKEENRKRAPELSRIEDFRQQK